jgi:hypothetical protein
MRARYREDKATQAAARLLKLRGGAMSHLKLIKLLYLAERASLVRLGRPLTDDSCASLPHGPVLSATLDRINTAEAYRDGYWDLHIAPKAKVRRGPRGMSLTRRRARAESIARARGRTVRMDRPTSFSGRRRGCRSSSRSRRSSRRC